MPENVVIVTDSLSVDGGSARVALSSALALAARGIGVTVFAASGVPSAELAAHPNIRIVCTEQGEAMASTNRLIGAANGLWNRRVYREMKKLLTTLDPEKTVIHVHGWTKALSSSVFGSILMARFPVVITLHEYFTACPTGCLYLHRDQRVCTLKPMSFDCIRKNCDSRNYAIKLYRVVRQLIQQIFAGVPQRIIHFITVSKFSRRIIEPMLPGRSVFHAVDNPVEGEQRSRVEAELNAPFVFIGRLSAEKGGAFLAKAARLAKVPVVYIGDGPQRNEISEIYPDASFTGWLDRESVAAQLRKARCIVVPSLWYETLGLVVLEAAALGIPAIVPSDTAAADLVISGETGFAFTRGDINDLARRLVVCSDNAIVAKLSKAAYEAFWKKPPTMRDHVDSLLSTYREVLGSVAGPGKPVRSV